MLLEDRLAAQIAERLQQLADAHRRQARLGLEQPMDLGFEEVELRGRRRPRVLRRLSARDRAADGLAMQPGAPGELANRDPLDEVQTPQLCPLLHDQHVLPPDPIWTSPGQGASGRRGQGPRGGSPFNRRQRRAVFRRRRQANTSLMPVSRKGSRGSTARSWRDVLSLGRRLADLHLEAVLDVLPALLDSVYAPQARAILSTIPDGLASADARVAYAMARQAVVRADHARARSWFARAQAAATRQTDPRLIQRIAFELGCLQLQDGSLASARTVVAWVQGVSPGASAGADLIHLRALIADLHGDRRRAIALYHRAIVRSHDALTPLSHVLSLRNLAAAMVHERPRETIPLYQRAIELVHSEQLEAGAEPALRNGLGYAFICAGDFASARTELSRAVESSEATDRPTIGLYARFNQSMVDELEDRTEAASDQLELVRSQAEAQELSGLANWCRLRQVWLLLKDRRWDEARQLLSRARENCVPEQIDTIRTLDAFFALIDGQASIAAVEFHGLAETYEGRSDLVTAFALLLWEAVAQTDAGARRSATVALKRASALCTRAMVRLSPSWWAREAADAVSLLRGASVWPHPLHRVSSGIGKSGTPVLVSADARIWVDGRELPGEIWRRRTGSGVLRRLFRLLVESHPRSVTKERLADRLWPESEGDRALRNLAGAVNDLRRVATAVPGLRVRVSSGRLSLDAHESVTFRTQDPTDR